MKHNPYRPGLYRRCTWTSSTARAIAWLPIEFVDAIAATRWRYELWLAT